mmetsp:Transcript_20262/g.43899  ORF Transcript_20262/g.43899 Transcript_20262/m.43899 type:complete len:232 (-) Transcript_20262:1222-1917(-)
MGCRHMRAGCGAVRDEGCFGAEGGASPLQELSRRIHRALCEPGTGLSADSDDLSAVTTSSTATASAAVAAAKVATTTDARVSCATPASFATFAPPNLSRDADPAVAAAISIASVATQPAAARSASMLTTRGAVVTAAPARGVHAVETASRFFAFVAAAATTAANTTDVVSSSATAAAAVSPTYSRIFAFAGRSCSLSTATVAFFTTDSVTKLSLLPAFVAVCVGIWTSHTL